MTEPSLSLIKQSAQVLFRPGDLVEVRVPKARQARVISGYFADFDRLAKAIAAIERDRYPGVYWTLNPVDPALVARADHRALTHAENTTSDHEIVCRRWLIIDFDPKRPTGISSTDSEHDAAFLLADRVHDALEAEGWGPGIRADSGNGAHLLYRVELPNDADSKTLLQAVLESLAARFGTPQVDVDRTMFNASRIAKVYGTTARKGDDTPERPHRLSRLLYAPGEMSPLPVDLLRQCAAGAPSAARGSAPSRSLPPRQFPGGGNPPKFDVAGFLSRYGIAHRPATGYQGGYKYVLNECPFNPSHKAPDSAVFDLPDGLGFKCLHNSCSDNDWKAFREHFEGPRPARQFPTGRSSSAPPVLSPRDEDVPPGLRVEGAAVSAESASATGDAGDENRARDAAAIEGAVTAACEAKDLDTAMRLIPEISLLPLHSYALVEGKLRKHFKGVFPLKAFRDAVDAEREKSAAPPPVSEEDLPPEDAPDLITNIPLTDSGNGERLVKLYGDDIRFCPEFKKWLLWDGRRWRVDTDAATVTQKAKNMARLLHQQACARLNDDKPLQRLVKSHARESESQGAISAALLRAKSEAGMQISAADLDKHRYLLNCLNGVVDVRSGELLPFSRNYYITKLCHVNYLPESNPEKDCPRFLKLLNWAMGETPDMGELPERVTRMVGFLQKAFGYALTGDVSEKAAFIFYGAKGNNGKTTLLTVFKTILAEYAAQLDINTLMTSKFTDNNVRADLAKLHGARFVITSEVDDGQRLSERLMKYLTAGMGEITACRKFENPFEFHATHKIWMDCNYRPEIKGADEAIWGRLMCVPFLQRLNKDDPSLDKQLIDKLIAESEGILSWTVRGAVRWRKEGLDLPVEVKDAVAEWRDADDPLKGFFEESCEVAPDDPHCWVRCKDFTRAYQDWCKANNEPQLKATRLTQRLKMKGIELNRSRRVGDEGTQVRCWDGVRLLEDVTLVSAPRSGRSSRDE